MKNFLVKICCCCIKKRKLRMDDIYFPTQQELYNEDETAKFLPSISLTEIYVE